MAYVTECKDHVDCLVIQQGDFPAEAGSWRSHAPATVRPEVRLNLDQPEIEDRRVRAKKGSTLRWAMPTVAEARVLMGVQAVVTVDPLTKLADEASAKGLNVNR